MFLSRFPSHLCPQSFSRSRVQQDLKTLGTSQEGGPPIVRSDYLASQRAVKYTGSFLQSIECSTRRGAAQSTLPNPPPTHRPAVTRSKAWCSGSRYNGFCSSLRWSIVYQFYPICVPTFLSLSSPPPPLALPPLPLPLSIHLLSSFLVYSFFFVFFLTN